MLAGKILVQDSNQISEIDHFNFIKNGRIFFIEVNVHKKIKNLLKNLLLKRRSLLLLHWTIPLLFTIKFGKFLICEISYENLILAMDAGKGIMTLNMNCTSLQLYHLHCRKHWWNIQKWHTWPPRGVL